MQGNRVIGRVWPRAQGFPASCSTAWRMTRAATASGFAAGRGFRRHSGRRAGAGSARNRPADDQPSCTRTPVRGVSLLVSEHRYVGAVSCRPVKIHVKCRA